MTPEEMQVINATKKEAGEAWRRKRAKKGKKRRKKTKRKKITKNTTDLYKPFPVSDEEGKTVEDMYRKTFKHQEDGVYFRMQRRGGASITDFYVQPLIKQSLPQILFTSFPKVNNGLLLTLKYPYQFTWVKDSVENATSSAREWNDVYIKHHIQFKVRQWTGYAVRITKTQFSLYSVDGANSALIYSVEFDVP